MNKVSLMGGYLVYCDDHEGFTYEYVLIPHIRAILFPYALSLINCISTIGGTNTFNTCIDSITRTTRLLVCEYIYPISLMGC